MSKRQEGFNDDDDTPTWPSTTAAQSITTQDPDEDDDDKHYQGEEEVLPVRDELAVAGPARQDELPTAAQVGEQMLAHQLTTVMVRNVHNRICAAEFATRLDALGFKDFYDLCLIPTDPKSGRGKGYGFVNFLTPYVASRFCSMADTLSFEPNKILQVSVARMQGSELTLQSRKLKEKKNRRGTILFTAT
jgi:hypothetical protein